MTTPDIRPFRRCILGPGTFGYKGELALTENMNADWFCPGHDTYQWLATDMRLQPITFIWDGQIGGIGFGKKDLYGWMAAGVQLAHTAAPVVCPEMAIPGSELIVIAHSHFTQVALCAAAAGMKIALLVSVCGPVRADMMDIAKRARPNIQRWVHLHGGRKDRWQIRGSLFDSMNPRDWFKVQRTHPLADINRGLSEADHSVYLRDPAWRWVLREALAEAPVWPVPTIPTP